MYVPERRRDPRFPIQRPLKLRNELTGKYLAGSTINLSSRGALIRIDAPGLLLAGQRIKIALAFHPGQALLPAGDMLEATVVRNYGPADNQQIAIEFDHRQSLPAAA